MHVQTQNGTFHLRSYANEVREYLAIVGLRIAILIVDHHQAYGDRAGHDRATKEAADDFSCLRIHVSFLAIERTRATWRTPTMQ